MIKQTLNRAAHPEPLLIGGHIILWSHLYYLA